MIERSPYYRGLSIPQIETAANFSDAEFETWVRRGAPVRALDVLLEEKHARAHKGQVPPSSSAAQVRVKGQSPAELGDGKIGEFGLALRPDRMPTSVDNEYADAAMNRFLGAYQQFLPSQSNAKKIVDFLGSRGAKVTYDNLVIAFERLFGQLELRIVEKGVETSETKLTGKRGERVQVAPYHFAKPVESKLFETILSPVDVRALSADDTQKMSRPMTFPTITSSATEYAKSEEFLSETPEPQSRSDQEQTESQIKREVEIFKISHPEFGRYLDDPEHYRGLYEIILDRIGSWNLLINESSLLDAFKSIEADGILKSKDSDKGIHHGQVTVMKVTPDARRHWTKSEISKAIRNMSSAEFQKKLNEDIDFRNAVDSSR